MLRPPSHIFPGGSSSGLPRPHELPGSAFPPTGLPGRPPYDTVPISTAGFLGAPSHLGMFICVYVNFGFN